MTAPRFDVLGIGNAIVDVLARVEDDFLVAEKLHKGSMNLIETERAEYLYAKMGGRYRIFRRQRRQYDFRAYELG